MFWLYLLAPCVVAFVVFVLFAVICREEFPGFLAFLSFVACAAIVIASATVTLVSSSNQTWDNEKLIQLSQSKKIYQERAENLTKQFVNYLAEVYPNHEKDIYEKICPDNVDVYLAKYPELKSSETIIALVKQIRELNDDTYRQDLERAEVLCKMRFRPKNPWVIQWFMPKDIAVPES